MKQLSAALQLFSATDSYRSQHSKDKFRYALFGNGYNGIPSKQT